MCVDENAAAPDRPYVPPVLFEGLDDGATLRPLHDFAHSHPFPHFGSFSHSCSDLCPSPDTDTRSISIAHDQTYLSLRFSAIDYLDAPGYSFEYRMGRTDTLWHRTVGGPLLSLVGLAPGTYRLAVRYRHGTVVSAPRTLTVRVLPPWWASPWAMPSWPWSWHGAACSCTAWCSDGDTSVRSSDARWRHTVVRCGRWSS